MPVMPETLRARDFAPSALLRPWVAGIRVMTSPPSAPRTFTRLPSDQSSIVFCVDREGTKLVAVGPSLRATYKQASTIPLYVRVELEPGTVRALLGVAAYELTDRMVSVDELGALERLEDLWQLAADRDFERLIEVLEHALIARIASRAAPAPNTSLARAALSALGGADVPSVAAVAARLGVSERHLRQICQEEIGLSPKRIARIARIRRATALAGKGGWARVAMEAGFYDQAHLNAEFRTMLGVSPRRFLEGKLPLRDSCAAS